MSERGGEGGGNGCVKIFAIQVGRALGSEHGAGKSSVQEQTELGTALLPAWSEKKKGGEKAKVRKKAPIPSKEKETKKTAQGMWVVG